jgi:prolyl 4-hydroxylase
MNTIVYSTSPTVVLFDNFLTEDQISKVGVESLAFDRSKGFSFADKSSKLTDSRTSSTYHEYRPEMDFIYKLALDSLRDYFPDLNREHMESIQITRYENDQSYVPHWDYFNVPGYTNTVSNDRRGTLIIYLNDNFGGGTTYFPRLGLHIHPRAGSAAFFRYDYSPTENEETLHSGEPVSNGTKYIMTIWIRNEKYV